MRELNAEESLLISGGCLNSNPVQLMDTIEVTATYEESGFNFGELVAIGGVLGGGLGLEAWLAGEAGALSVEAAVALGGFVGAGVTIGTIVAFSAGYAAGTFLYNKATGIIYNRP